LSYICLDEKNKKVKQGMGRTLNVSESGILLETNFPIDTKHIVLLTIGLEEDIVDIKGKAVHSKTNTQGLYEVGIEFMDTDNKANKILKKFIRAMDKTNE
jgi:hypothetical protein